MHVKKRLYGLGWAQLNSEKYRSALDTFQQLGRTFPRTRFQESVSYARVKSYLGLRQMPAAQDTYRQLAREFPQGKWLGAATVEFARTAYEAGDYATAASLRAGRPDQASAGACRPCYRAICSIAREIYRAMAFAVPSGRGSLTTFRRPPC